MRDLNICDREGRQGGELSRGRQIAKLVRKLHNGRSAKHQAAQILSSPFLPQHHLAPEWRMPWDMCLGWHLASACYPSPWYPSLALVLRQEQGFNISHCISLCSALCTDAAQRAPAAPQCCSRCPGAEMVPWVAVAAVVEHTLPCPPCAVLQVLAGSHW